MIEPARVDRLRARSVARLAAVQALYEMDIAGTDLAEVIANRRAGTVGREIEGVSLALPDLDFMQDVVTGVLREQNRLDPEIDECLAEGWSLGRIDSTLRAILRAGAYELSMRREIPFRVSITEYVELAHAFFDGPESKVVNGVLDRMARNYGRTEPAPGKG